MSTPWTRHPPIELASPALAVLCGPDGVWAGGLGGVARYVAESGWTPLISGLPFTPATALAHGAGCLLAGGAGGNARSTDGGLSWQQTTVPGEAGTVTAITLSPSFAQDGTALAATLDNGILRSTDQGREWQTSSFGLTSREVVGLAWGEGETVVAATATGLARSPNAGRAWRVCAGTEEVGFAALAALVDGTALAATDGGELFRSPDNFKSWSPAGSLPDDAKVWALAALAGDAVLVGTADHGLLRSADGGSTWAMVSPARALSFSAYEGRVCAGTSTGVMLSDDAGQTWTDLPTSPLHDLRRLLVISGTALVAGTNSPPVVRAPDGAWTPREKTPLPLSSLVAVPDGAIFASSPDGLFRSSDVGASWEPVVAGENGRVARITFLPGGHGWAGVTPDAALLRTGDCGRSWERLPSPFGVLPLVALQAFPGTPGRDAVSLMAATYDDRQRAVGIWRSDDGGEQWARGADSYTPWPVVATCGSPAVVTVGNMITVQQPDRAWQHATVGEGGIRRVVTDGATLLALAGNGIWRTENYGQTWARDDAGLAVDQILDIALDAGSLHVLLAGGELWSRPL